MTWFFSKSYWSLVYVNGLLEDVVTLIEKAQKGFND